MLFHRHQFAFRGDGIVHANERHRRDHDGEHGQHREADHQFSAVEPFERGAEGGPETQSEDASMTSGVPESCAGMISDQFSSLFELRRGFRFGNLFDDEAARCAESLLFLLAIRFFSLLADHWDIFERRNQHHHAGTAFLNERGQGFFDLRRQSFDAPRVDQRFAHIDDAAGQFGHGSDQICAGIHTALSTHRPNLDAATFLRDHRDTIATEE